MPRRKGKLFLLLLIIVVAAMMLRLWQRHAGRLVWHSRAGTDPQARFVEGFNGAPLPSI